MLPIRKLILLLTLLIVFGASENKAARILAVFPTPSISHQVVFRPIVQELVKRGHEVVVITPDPVFSKEESLKNLTEIDVHDLSYNIFADFFKNPVGSEDSSIGGLKTGYILCTNIFAHQMRTAEVQKILKEGNFDLLLLEAWFRPGMALSHIIKVPVILVSSFGGVLGMYESMGAPAHPFLYPDMFQQRIHQITLWEKLSELYKLHLLHKLDKEIMAFQLEIARDLFGKDVPDFPELYKNVDMMFLNVHPIFEFNRPVPPNIIYMGGLPQHSIKDLPKDLKSHLDSSKNGVIYISFGTNTKPSSFPKETMDTMLRVVSKLPYDVLFKWDSDELPQKPANVRISKWWPQADLLMHPKIKLFITQGGLQSTDEAITAGVPLIGIPMLGDQWYNVERYRGLGIGVRLDMDSITEDRLRDTINTVIEDESYRNNIVTLRSRMHDQPQSSLECAIWWTEYVLRHGGAKHLRSPAADISWSEYLELEMVLTILLLAAIIVLGLGLSLYYVYKYFFRNFLVDVKIKRT